MYLVRTHLDSAVKRVAPLRTSSPLRLIIGKLLAEKLTFGPEERDGRRGFRFTGTGTVEKLIAGAVPASFLAVVPPTGFEPVLPP